MLLPAALGITNLPGSTPTPLPFGGSCLCSLASGRTLCLLCKVSLLGRVQCWRCEQNIKQQHKQRTIAGCRPSNPIPSKECQPPGQQGTSEMHSICIQTTLQPP